MSDLEKKFIKRVREEIAVRGLTLTSVSEMIGSSRQVLSQILNGKFNSMRADTMLKLARLLRISLDEIIFPVTDLIDRFKIYGYKLRDLILFAEMCNRNDVRESDLKQAAWNLELAARAVMNERQEIVKNTMAEITMRFTPDFVKAYEEMRGENDEQNKSNH